MHTSRENKYTTHSFDIASKEFQGIGQQQTSAATKRYQTKLIEEKTAYGHRLM